MSVCMPNIKLFHIIHKMYICIYTLAKNQCEEKWESVSSDLKLMKVNWPYE